MKGFDLILQCRKSGLRYRYIFAMRDNYLYIVTTAALYILKIYPLRAAIFILRLTVVSREAKKKQHACASPGPRDHYSELFTRMAALKF